MDKIRLAVEDIEKELKKIKSIFAVILYGSVSRGDYSVRHSDIDILIILETNKEKDIIKKIIGRLNIKHRVKIHPEFQISAVSREDETLLCKMFEEGKVLFSRGFWFMDKDKLGLKPFRLYIFDTKNTNKVNRVILSRALHGRIGYKGIINDASVIYSGKSGLLVRDDMWVDIESLFKRLDIKFRIERILYG